MLASKCVESRPRDLIEQGFEVAAREGDERGPRVQRSLASPRSRTSLAEDDHYEENDHGNSESPVQARQSWRPGYLLPRGRAEERTGRAAPARLPHHLPHVPHSPPPPAGPVPP